MSQQPQATSDIQRLRLLLADPDTILTDGIRCLLGPDFVCAAAVTDGRALVNAAREIKPDVIIAEIVMPSMSGIEALREIRVHDAAVKMIFLSAHAEAVYAAEAMRAGASGYLLKTCNSEELTRTIWIASTGGSYVSPRVDPVLLGSMMSRRQSRGTHLQLTARQMEILQLIAAGRTRREIGAILNVSLKTVEFHKSRIAEKLQLSSTTQLMRYAIENGIAPREKPHGDIQQ
jgi:DNA-binding NarL/FixJ family response regulator